jgi:transcriptional regulator with XRE-family HTH domain
MTDPTVDFIEILRMERLRRRIKQGVIATQLGVKQGAVCNWESGRVVPTDEHLRMWACALDVTVPANVRGAVARVATCGTLGGRERHRRVGEPVCDPCRLAYNAYQRAHRSVSPP